ncbi:MAG: hypothetical protein AB1414_09565 [bacterium]
MKNLKGLDEIHEIMEKIYEEEKKLSFEQRVKKIRDESDKFILERKLGIKRVKPKELKYSMA